MAEKGIERDPVEVMVTEFLEKRRHGEAPSIDELLQRHPESAESIQKLLPVVGALERLKKHRDTVSGGAVARGVRKLRQLGDFRIVRELGRGGMGVVFEAEQETLARRVAVKVMPKLPLLSEKRLAQFRHEASIAAKLHHTHIVPVFGAGHEEDYHYYVMQLIHGVGLDALIVHLQVLTSGTAAEVAAHHNCTATALARAVLSAALAEIPKSDISNEFKDSFHCELRRKGPWPPSNESPFPPSVGDSGESAGVSDSVPAESLEKRACSGLVPGATYWRNVAVIGQHAAEALDYAHRQNTLHRDLKPGNLLLDMEGNVWIADFGLARALELDESLSGDIVGTLRYMAPEEFSGASDARSDLYSLGITLYEMLTLTPAFSAKSRGTLIKSILENKKTAPRQINASIPRDMETIVLKATAHDPDHRYASASELADDLARFLKDRPIRARRTTAVEQAWRWARRNPSLAALVSLTLFSFLLAVIVSGRAYLRATDDNRRIIEALGDVAEQRQRAENVSNVALSSLDNIFAELSPARIKPESGQVIAEVKGVKKVSFVFSEQTAALLQQMLVFYDRLSERTGKNAVLMSKMGQANRRLGFTRYMMGQYPEAEAHYRVASEVFHDLIDRTQEPESLLHVAVEIENERGEVYWAMEQPDRATECFQEALRLFDALPDAAKIRPENRFLLAQTNYLLRKRLAPSRYPAWLRLKFPELAGSDDWWGDEDNLEQAASIAAGLFEECPKAPDYRHLLGICYRDRLPELRLRGQLPSDQSASELLEQLAADYPDISDYFHDLALAYSSVNSLGPDFDKALYGEQFGFGPGSAGGVDAATRILDKITRENPNTVKYIEDLASLHHVRGELSVVAGSPKASQFLRAEGLLLALEERFPEVASYKIWRAIVQLTLAPMQTSNPDFGIAGFESGVSSLEAVAKSDSIPDSVIDLVNRSATELAEMLSEKGYVESAAEAIHRAERAHFGP